ncbi:hypothetical protein E4T56_gene12473 [Termitomyces sp. T112]|nr:hypothetical protein E4T56_gene12473 [Termitomyces sp. T112]
MVPHKNIYLSVNLSVLFRVVAPRKVWGRCTSSLWSFINNSKINLDMLCTSSSQRMGRGPSRTPADSTAKCAQL